jgi:hypothetical protein
VSTQSSRTRAGYGPPVPAMCQHWPIPTPVSLALACADAGQGGARGGAPSSLRLRLRQGTAALTSTPSLREGVPACHAVSRCDFGWVPASTRCAGTRSGLTCARQAVTASPAALATFTAALMSRSSHAPHARHCQMRACSGLGPSFTPHRQQVCEVGSNRPIRWNSRPYNRVPVVLTGPEPRLAHSRPYAPARGRGDEVPVSAVQVRQCLLQHYRRNLIQPRPSGRFLDRCQPGRQLCIGEVRLASLVRGLPVTQRVVEHHPGAPERLG